jgi:uracil-DNA glycosylase
MHDQSTRGAAEGVEFLPKAWDDFLGPRSHEILEPILERLAQAGDYFPRGQVFRAFELCGPDALKACVMGQDPYHGVGQAHGLAFSVPAGVAVPPSLRNVFKELRSDLGWASTPSCGDLSPWASQGALLLNALLTVKPHQPGSHADLGWQVWTDFVLERISQELPGTVFVLWGEFAKKKARLLAPGASVVVGGHPSPLSANRGGFFGGAYFSKANVLLAQAGREPLNWGALLEPPQGPA